MLSRPDARHLTSLRLRTAERCLQASQGEEQDREEGSAALAKLYGVRNAKDIGPKLSMDLRGRGDGQNERTLARNVLKFNVTGSVKRLLEEQKGRGGG